MRSVDGHISQTDRKKTKTVFVDDQPQITNRLQRILAASMNHVVDAFSFSLEPFRRPNSETKMFIFHRYSSIFGEELFSRLSSLAEFNEEFSTQTPHLVVCIDRYRYSQQFPEPPNVEVYLRPTVTHGQRTPWWPRAGRERSAAELSECGNGERAQET